MSEYQYYEFLAIDRPLTESEGAYLRNELLARFRREHGGDNASVSNPRRTVKELLQGVAKREQAAAEKAIEERARQERKAILARNKYIDKLAGRESNLWGKIEQLIATKLPKNYDEAVQLLVDLQDLAIRKKKNNFKRRFESFRKTHAQKSSLIRKMKKAGL